MSKINYSSIAYYARIMEKFCMVLMASAVFTLLIRWTQDINPLLKNMGGFWLPYLDRNMYPTSNSLQHLISMTLGRRFAGFLLDGITMTIVLLGLYCCVKLMRSFQKGDIFSEETITQLANISKVALLWALYGPINVLMMGIIAFLATPEQHAWALGYAVDDSIVKLVFFAFFFVLTLMMREGYRLKREEELTV